MQCQECFGYMKLEHINLSIGDFIIYKCPDCGHERKFSRADILILMLESLKEQC